MKIAIGILTLIAVALGWQLIAEKEANNKLRGHVAALTSKLSDKTVRENLELQEKCATQAEKLFREFGYSGQDLATNQSHFNTKLNKCFMSVSSTDKNGIFRFLIDAYEQRGYASYSRTVGNMNFLTCSLTPLAEKEKICNDKEYDEFVARYME